VLADKRALTLLLLSLGSLSFAVCDSFGGAYADRNGCKSAMKLGIKWMTGLMVLFAAISLFSNELQFFAVILAAIGQILVGFPLALIDGADTQLTKTISRQVKGLTEADGDHLEGICTQLKYSGLAVASFIGCLIYVMASAWLKDSIPLAAAILFLLTAVAQIIALRQIRAVEEPDTTGRELPGRKASENPEMLLGRCRSALRSIYADKVLATWVLIIAVTEGWLLFSTSYFQLDALEDSIKTAKDYYVLILIIPITYWLLSAVASIGGSFFNRWHKKAAKDEDGSPVKLRGGSLLDIPHVRLIAAGKILGIMLGVFVLHLLISAVFPQDGGDKGNKTYWLSLVSLCFFAVYQFLRGFAHPLLKTTLSNMASARSLQNPTTTLSVATAAGRSFHAVSALLFLICLRWVKASGTPGSEVAIRALAATVVIIVLTLVVLNVFSGLALDRKKIDGGEPGPLPPTKAIRAMLSSRAFRSTAIKGAFFVCLAMSNILALKLCKIGFLEFNAGALAYALTFMLVDTIAETEGKTKSRQLWLAGVFTYAVVGLLVFVAVTLPPGPKQVLQPLFDRLFQVSPPISFGLAFDGLFQQGVLIFIGASLCSFAVAQYLDIWVFLLLKRVFRGKALWLRNNVSTFIAQTVDTIIFVGIWFGLFRVLLPKVTGQASLTWSFLFILVIGQLGVKWIFSLLYTPLLYGAVRWIETGKDPQHLSPNSRVSDRKAA
jgi:uncharacterized integral membrane protein (TIGR00697 family)